MEKAQAAGGNGPGKVTPTKLKFDRNWGKLPEKDGTVGQYICTGDNFQIAETLGGIEISVADHAAADNTDLGLFHKKSSLFITFGKSVGNHVVITLLQRRMHFFVAEIQFHDHRFHGIGHDGDQFGDRQ